MCFMVNMDDLGLDCVVAGDHLHDVGPLMRERMVTAEECRGY
jgi:hypothetical protein